MHLYRHTRKYTFTSISICTWEFGCMFDPRTMVAVALTTHHICRPLREWQWTNQNRNIGRTLTTIIPMWITNDTYERTLRDHRGWRNACESHYQNRSCNHNTVGGYTQSPEVTGSSTTHQLSISSDKRTFRVDDALLLANEIHTWATGRGNWVES